MLNEPMTLNQTVDGSIALHGSKGTRLLITKEQIAVLADEFNYLEADFQERERIDRYRTALIRRQIDFPVLQPMPTKEENANKTLVTNREGMISLDEAASAAIFKPVRVAIIGTCMTQYAEQSIHQAGIDIESDWIISHYWLESEVLNYFEVEDYEVVILQMGSWALLRSLFEVPGLDSKARYARRLGKMLASWAETMSEKMTNFQLCLVHNIAKPAYWPADETPNNWESVWHALNEPIEEAIRSRSNLELVDENMLAYRHGALNIFDDSVFPWAHHGGPTDINIRTPHQGKALGDVIGQEYASIYVAKNTGFIKVIACDLDGVIWPNNIAETGTDWLANDFSTDYWLHMGLQEVLANLEKTGVILVSVSKGDENVTLPQWRNAEKQMLLAPGKFAQHYISWQDKPCTMETILRDLSTTPDRVIFLDDHPVERRRMAAAFPDMTIPDLPVGKFRSFLLNFPGLRFQSFGDKKSRTATTGAAITRTRDRAIMTNDDFYSNLGLSVSFEWLGESEVLRGKELLDRTTQFNISGSMDIDEELRLHSIDRQRILAMWVRDKYADYGLVGLSIVDESNKLLVGLAVSCRVLGLGVATRLAKEHMQRLSLNIVGVNFKQTLRNSVVTEMLGSDFRIDSGGTYSLSLGK